MLAGLTTAVASARARVWNWGRGPDREPLDFDSTLVQVESKNKHLAAPNWKHGFEYTPCWCIRARLEKRWVAPSGLGTPAPTPPAITWACWTRHSLNCHCLPANRMTRPGNHGESIR